MGIESLYLDAEQLADLRQFDRSGRVTADRLVWHRELHGHPAPKCPQCDCNDTVEILTALLYWSVKWWEGNETGDFKMSTKADEMQEKIAAAYEAM